MFATALHFSALDNGAIFDLVMIPLLCAIGAAIYFLHFRNN